MMNPPQQILELTGPDAAAFAHAQFCNDVLALADGDWQWNAWLNPQGRVRAFFRLQRGGPARIALTLRGGDAEWLRDELLRFVFRANVQFTVATGMPESTTLADIRAGLPEIGVGLRDQLLPQWIGLDRLGAVSVRKGCYPGQEIMARLHFKGGNKRSLYRIGWPGDIRPRPGTSLHGADGHPAGVIVLTASDTANATTECLASLNDGSIRQPLRMDAGQADPIRVLEHFG